MQQHFETWELVFLALVWVVAWVVLCQIYWPLMTRRDDDETNAQKAERQFDEFP